MRVLIPVDHAVGISGPHRNVVGSLNALGARSDVEVVLLTDMIDQNEPYARAHNIEVRLGFRPHDPKAMPANAWRMWSAARGCKVIYVPTGLKTLLAAQVAHLGRRLVAGPNVTPLPVGRRRDVPGQMELRWLCDAWFEASRARRDVVRRATGNGAIGHIHHAIDTAKFSPALRDPSVWSRLDVPEADVRVLYVGKDYELKGVAQLLDAASRLAGHCQDIRFMLVGSMSDETLRRASELPNVSVVGFRMGAELACLQASADLAIVPSSWENFPFTVLEAMASGLPVIGSRTGGIPEMIVDGETGLLVDIADGRRHYPDAGERLAAAICSLVERPEQLHAMGAAARQRVLNHFSERRLGDDLMAIFRGQAAELLAGDA
jgi:glycosyltransferase involved in cell wall biosynthesis